ncbi:MULTISPECIES: hypothetical protein [Moorena]|uniref:hypothetical protein n=1 Tax=Moorena TaxID=1155738 RepID=UPI001C030DDB|nr:MULTISPECIES: hypothetical protein [Moorena]
MRSELKWLWIISATVLAFIYTDEGRKMVASVGYTPDATDYNINLACGKRSPITAIVLRECGGRNLVDGSQTNR